MSGAAAGALLEAGDLLWCPCVPVELSLQVTMAFLSTLPVSVCRSSGQRDAREAPGSLQSPQGRLCCARRAALGMAELLLGSTWQSWLVLSLGWPCCLLQLGASQSCQAAAIPLGFLRVPPSQDALQINLHAKLWETPVGGEKPKLQL